MTDSSFPPLFSLLLSLTGKVATALKVISSASLIGGFLDAKTINHPCDHTNRLARYFYAKLKDIDPSKPGHTKQLLFWFILSEVLQQEAWDEETELVSGPSGMIVETPAFNVWNEFVPAFQQFMEIDTTHPSYQAYKEGFDADDISSHLAHFFHDVLPTIPLGHDANGNELFYRFKTTKKNKSKTNDKKKNKWSGKIFLERAAEEGADL